MPLTPGMAHFDDEHVEPDPDFDPAQLERDVDAIESAEDGDGRPWTP